MTKTTQNFFSLNQRALSIALNAYCSDWDEFDDPRDALAAIADDDGRVTLWAPVEDLPADEVCDAIETLAADIYNALIEKA